MTTSTGASAIKGLIKPLCFQWFAEIQNLEKRVFLKKVFQNRTPTSFLLSLAKLFIPIEFPLFSVYPQRLWVYLCQP